MKETKKILLATLVISLVLFSSLTAMAGSASATAPKPRASGSFTVNPMTYAAGQEAIAVVNGGTFGSGATVEFYLSEDTEGDTSDEYLGKVTLDAGATSLHNNIVKFTIPAGTEPGTYYILATDDGESWAAGPEVHVVEATPEVHIEPANVHVGDTPKVWGDGFDPNADIKLYLERPGGTLLGTATTDSTGYFKIEVEIREMQGGEYDLIAQEVESISSDYPYGGITADTTFTILPDITVTPISTQGNEGDRFTIEGTGFKAGQEIEEFTSSDTGSSSIIIAGVNTYHSAVTVNTHGSFRVSVTLADDVPSSYSGELPIDIYLTNPTEHLTFDYKLWRSLPYVNPTLVFYTLSYDVTESGKVGEEIYLLLSGFPDNSQVNVHFNSEVFKVNTDSNGFKLEKISVPALPGGEYHVFAESKGISASADFTIKSSYSITDSRDWDLTGEHAGIYAAPGSVITFHATGLAPYAQVTLGDGIWGDFGERDGAYDNGLVEVVKGSFSSSSRAFFADANGEFMAEYTVYYALWWFNTGETKGLYFGVVGDIPHTGSYKTIGYASVEGLEDSYQPEATVNLDVRHLVPSGEEYTQESASYVEPYQVYVDNTLITLSTHRNYFLSDDEGHASVEFKLPSSIGTGLHTLSIVTEGGVVLYQDLFVVSKPTLNSGNIVLNEYTSDILGGTGTYSNPLQVYPGYELKFELYNFPRDSTITVTYYDSDGENHASLSPDDNGYVEFPLTIPQTPGNIPYLISFSATVGGHSVSITGDTWYYETVPAISLREGAPYSHLYGEPATDYYDTYHEHASAGDRLTIYYDALLANTVYNVYWSDSSSFADAVRMKHFQTPDSGSGNFEVTIPPYVATGTYYIGVAPASSDNIELYVTVEVIQAAPLYAFPGQVVNVGPIEVDPPENLAYYIVTINLNGTAYKTLDVVPTESGGEYYLSFSFQMPNGNPGNYWYVGYNITPVVVNTIQESIPASAVATSITPDTYDISTSYPESTYSEYGEATFTLPYGYEVDTSTIHLDFDLEPGTGMGSSAAVSVVGYNIVGATQSGNTLTVKYVVTFTLTGFHVNPAVVNVVSVKASFRGTAHDQESTGTPITITAPDTFTSDSVTGTATFDIPDELSGISVSNFNVPLSSASGGTASWVGFSSTESIGTGQITVSYSGQIQISDWTTAPVTVNVGTPTLQYSGTYTATSNIAVTPDKIHSDGSDSQSATLAVAVTVPDGMTVNNVNSVSITLSNESTGTSITDPSIAVNSFTQSGTVVLISVTVTYTDDNVEDLNVSVSQVQMSVSGSLTGSASPTSYELHPTYADSASGSASVPLSLGYEITHIDSTEPSTEPAPVFTSLTYSPGAISGSTIPYDIEYELRDFVAGENYEVPLPEFDFDFSATNIEGTPSPDSYTEVFSGTFTMQGTAAFDVGTNEVAAIDNFALEMSSPGSGSYVNETGLVVNNWYVDGNTLYVKYSVTFSVYNTLTVNVDSAKVSYHYIDTTTTQSVDTADAINDELSYPITLVQGKGAYIMGITDEQIAEIIAAVNSTITASMEVPLAQLNASVEAINDAVAQINTAFGTMYATLDAINATVVAIYDGMATVQTDIGTIKTALLDLNATIEGISGDVVELKTAVGELGVKLDQINATLESISGDVMNINTVVGDIQASVSDLNAKVDSISGDVATIKTDVGNIKASVSDLDAKIMDVQGALVTLRTNLGYVNTTIQELKPVIEEINDNVMTIKTVVGDINMNLTEFKNAVISEIDNGVATVVGEIDGLNVTMQAKLDALDAKIVDVQNDIVTIQTRLGDIQMNISALDAKIVDVQNGIATIQTTLGDIQASLSDLDAKITDVQNGIATIQTDIGNIQTSLSNLNAKITSLQGDIANVQTSLGDIQVSLEDINATVVANANSLDDLKGSAAEIKTSLGDIEGTITDIKDGIATIKTDMGTVKTDVSDIKTTTQDTSGSVSTTLYWEIGVLVLVIITLVLVVYVLTKVNKIAEVAKEETAEEEETE